MLMDKYSCYLYWKDIPGASDLMLWEERHDFSLYTFPVSCTMFNPCKDYQILCQLVSNCQWLQSDDQLESLQNEFPLLLIPPS